MVESKARLCHRRSETQTKSALLKVSILYDFIRFYTITRNWYLPQVSDYLNRNQYKNGSIRPAQPHNRR